jgi:hypothetical protein
MPVGSREFVSHGHPVEESPTGLLIARSLGETSVRPLLLTDTEHEIKLPEYEPDLLQEPLGFIAYQRFSSWMEAGDHTYSQAARVWSIVYSASARARQTHLTWLEENGDPTVLGVSMPNSPSLPTVRVRQPLPVTHQPLESILLMRIEGDDPLPSTQRSRQIALRDRGRLSADSLYASLSPEGTGITNVGPAYQRILAAAVSERIEAYHALPR